MNTHILSTRQTRLARLFASTAFAATLAACGGGGSDAPGNGVGGTPPPAPAPAPSPAPGFSVALSTEKLLLIQGHTANITATITRENGFNDAVNLQLKDLPAGVSAAPVLIARGASSATVTLIATANAPHSLPTAAKADGSAGDKTASKGLSVTVGGLPGVVDTSFNGGPQLTSVGDGEDYAFAMTVQPDGKIVTVGRTSTDAGGYDIAITRHLRDGAIDTGFGTEGKVVTAIAPGRGMDEARAVVVQPDGKIVVGGSTDASGTDKAFLLVRYLPDGRIDTSFGQGGKAITQFEQASDQVYALALQDDGKIVAAGSASFPGDTGHDFAIARYRTDGTLDPAFGIAGKVSTPFGSFGANELAYAVVLQRFGDEQRIVAVGGEGTFIAARYTSMGLLDPNFGDGGKVHALFQSNIGSAESVTLTEDNKIVIAGHIGHEFALAQLTTDGQLDTEFGEEGKVTTPISLGNWDEATAVVRQADGKLLVGGWSYEGHSTAGNFVVLRYTAQGRADFTFGLAGQVIAPVAPPWRSDAGRALALQPDDRVPTVRLIQAGEATDGSYKFALQRYWL
jgi:uncharacterized delta-60 repeat protein